MSGFDWRGWRQAFFRWPSLAEISPSLAELRQLCVQVRQPVFPITSRDLQARLGTGLKVAFWITLPAFAVISSQARDYQFVMFIFGFPIIMAGAAIVSFVHAIVLRLLPLRGFATPVVLAMLMALLIVHLQRDMTVAQRNWTFLLLGLYGIIIGVIGPPDERARACSRRARQAS